MTGRTILSIRFPIPLRRASPYLLALDRQAQARTHNFPCGRATPFSDSAFNEPGESLAQGDVAVVPDDQSAIIKGVTFPTP